VKEVAASLQGLAPLAGWVGRRWVSPLATASLALLGFILPEALSLRASDPVSRTLLSGTSVRAPSRVPFPVLQSVKEHGSWLVSFETAGLFEVCVLVPAPPG
jgi:hypothetical protein